jgi:hypothetical protein
LRRGIVAEPALGEEQVQSNPSASLIRVSPGQSLLSFAVEVLNPLVSRTLFQRRRSPSDSGYNTEKRVALLLPIW